MFNIFKKKSKQFDLVNQSLAELVLLNG
ncbi:uncharacterized protein METZ01_LOCUS59735 [marine metagenome]|uniref:Uncharacterized protein n=1 Tax=marine metagenome TaxID=408172 RepID=A0A381SUB0_9ZZZZ